MSHDPNDVGLAWLDAQPVTRREAALAALATILQDALGPVGIPVTRNRPQNECWDAAPTVNVTDGGHREPDDQVHGETGYLVTCWVDGFIRAEGENAVALIGPRVSALYGAVLKSVLHDRTLGGVISDLAEGELVADVDTAPGHAVSAGFGLALTLRFETAPDDPYLPPQ